MDLKSLKNGPYLFKTNLLPACLVIINTPPPPKHPQKHPLSAYPLFLPPAVIARPKLPFLLEVLRGLHDLYFGFFWRSNNFELYRKLVIFGKSRRKRRHSQNFTFIAKLCTFFYTYISKFQKPVRGIKIIRAYY